MPEPRFFRRVRRIVPVLVVLLVCAWLFGPADGQAEETPAQPNQQQQGGADAEVRKQVGQLAAAVQLLRADKPEPARAIVSKLAETAPAPSLLHHTASLLKSDLTGGFAERMQPYLNRAVVPTVMLVPDEASFLAAVQQWPEDRFWPVLIEDDWFAPLFIDAFKPTQVVRWQRPEGEATAEQVAALTAEAIKTHNAQLLKGDSSPLPPGLLVIDPLGKQRCGGLALAIARGQPVMALSPEMDHRRRAPEDYIDRLNESIMNALIALKLVRDDSWSALTLAGDFPYEYDAKDGKRNPLAVDDLLGRDDRQIRRAATGRLVGDSVQAVYQAMGGLFLQPEDALLVNSYGYNANGDNTGYREYHLANAAPNLEQRLRVTLLQNKTATVDQFVKAERPKSPFGLYWINSAHGTKFLKLGGEALTREHMPVGSHAMYMVASFSADNPWDHGTLAAQCLSSGAYWFFGSVHEPYLQAFVHPAMMTHRMTNGTPMGFATRQVPGHPFYRPWKLMLIGDPLWNLRTEPAKQVEGPTLDGASPVDSSPAEQTATALLKHALLTQQDNRVELARSVLNEPLAVSPGLLAHAVRELWLAEDHRTLAALPTQVTRRHPVVEMYVLRSVYKELQRSIEAGKAPAATPLISRILAAQTHYHWRFRAARDWRDAMQALNQGAAANDHLRRLTQRMNSYHQKQFEKLMEADDQ